MATRRRDTVTPWPLAARQVRPYTDARDRDDTQLKDLIPFLVSIVKENIDDVPKLLSTYQSHHADSILRDYHSRVDSIKQRQADSKAKGIGGFVRRSRGSALAPEAAAAPREPAGLHEPPDPSGHAVPAHPRA